MFETPLLLLFFNRPDLAQEMISILRSVRANKIYIAVDGPRQNKPDDTEKINQVLEICRSIDWTTNTRFLIRERNLGCSPAIISALDWFFKQEERGIILEDDCQPHADFFAFCHHMLARYENDPRIALISGDSYVPFNLRHPAGYYFSKYTATCAWATWRRFYKTYDPKLASLSYEEWRGVICKYTSEGLERTFWLQWLDKLLLRGFIGWDWAVQFCAWRNGQLAIHPGTNLVTNVGFDRVDATHSTQPSHLGFRKTVQLTGPFPDQEVEADVELDHRRFWRYSFWTEDHLVNFFRRHDTEYARFVAECKRLEAANKELMELNKRLTTTAEQQDVYIRQLTLQLQQGNDASLERIHELEKQIALSLSKSGFLQRMMYDLTSGSKK